MTFLRIIFIVFLFYLIYRVLKGLGGPLLSPGADSHDDDLVQDPNCGVYLPRKEGLATTVEGRVLYFCSQKCKNEYLMK